MIRISFLNSPPFSSAIGFAFKFKELNDYQRDKSKRISIVAI
jgi:hypothetical protein